MNTSTSQSELHSIAEVAEEFNLTMRALRFYEQKELITPIRKGNRRFYDSFCLERLKFVLFCRSCGIPIDTIYIALNIIDENVPGGKGALQLQKIFEDHLASVEQRRAEYDVWIDKSRAYIDHVSEGGHGLDLDFSDNRAGTTGTKTS